MAVVTAWWQCAGGAIALPGPWCQCAAVRGRDVTIINKGEGDRGRAGRWRQNCCGVDLARWWQQWQQLGGSDSAAAAAVQQLDGSDGGGGSFTAAQQL